jgi:molybdopterin adenylyltransferase
MSSSSVAAVGTMLAKVITVSDGVFHGVREDRSGIALSECLAQHGWTVTTSLVVADGVESVSAAIRLLAEDFSGVIVTTGGTGFGPRDLTPEGTSAVLERQAPGLAEAMRLANPPLGRLSRGVAGTLGKSVVLNTPGSPKGCVECLEAVIDVLPHAVSLMTGETTVH